MKNIDKILKIILLSIPIVYVIWNGITITTGNITIWLNPLKEVFL